MFYRLVIFLLSLGCAETAVSQNPTPIPAIPASIGQNIINQINMERLRLGLRQLPTNDQQVCAASLQAAFLAGNPVYCGHVGPGGNSVRQRLSQCGGATGGWGEVVACGQTSFQQAVTGWMNSPGHRGIIMSSSAKSIGATMIGNRWVAVVGF